MSRLKTLAWWCLPTLVFVWVYWYGARAWFQQDDFAWLGQRREIHSLQDFFTFLFVPRAQGTIRTWSERLFFIVFFDRFGMDPRPYHLWVALTQVGSLLLLQAITFRLTASRLAAVVAPIVWVCGVGLANPASWLSAYNQVLCGFFLLLALWLLMKDRLAWQTVVFVLGFGALEINIVYPALAVGYCWCYARQHLKKVYWLFSASALYALIHFRFAEKPTSGPYARYWDLSMIPTYIAYWGNALAGGLVPARLPAPEWVWQAVAWVLGAVLAAFAVWSWRRGDRLAVYGAFWFTVLLSPVLPLRDHFMEYYLAIPSIGLALILAAVVRQALAKGWAWRAAALAILLIHLGFALPVSRQITRWRFERGHRIRALVEGLGRAYELHPRSLILVSGLDSEMFWSGFYDKPYRLYGASEVYLVPGSEKELDPHPELGEITPYVCSPATAARGLADGSAVVYSFEGTVLRNITRKYARQVPAEWFSARPRLVDVGAAASQKDLGPGWEPSEGSWRWMGRQAEVRLSGPTRPQDQLWVTGFCPESNLERPITLRVTAGSTLLGEFQVTKATHSFEKGFPLPAALLGVPEMVVQLSVDHTVSPPGDGRQLGLAIGQVALR
jgi:hypothetical protein